ncbi:RND family efflux transporter MFP subunit [Halospina denitrificans]|uniref:RND family efflux transporter MFP subunit n=1 Tax=Halospina denitrificans TaxID=332522 RepID=A0A4R7K3M7_9GAMM|nr:efflux RND transporter periplasmic adaptor subunit [Halospina denitrificans]TDT44209.1 RND family efflux transporter MFP subunit [Halospina denitrificans]
MSEAVNDSAARPETGRAGWFKTTIISILILALGAGLIWFIFRTEPSATRSEAPRDTAMLVEVTEVTKGTFRPTITAMGTVQPAREVVLRPRVSGMVVSHAPELTPGGIVEEGETLVRIDQADYETTLQQRRSELRQARADLEVEKGRQNVAEQEFQLLDEELSGPNRALVLRQPQLDSAQAAVEAAEAAVRQAQLQLERTRIKAPFDARVLTREVNTGSQVSTGESLARLVGVETYWVETTVPTDKLRWLSFPDGSNSEGAAVRVRNNTAWPEGVHREGRLYKLVGELEDNSRMARVLITIDDPFGLDSGEARKPPLLIGSYVENHIQGRAIQDVVKLDRNYVRRNNTVWVMADGELAIRDVEIRFQDAEHAYISSGLDDGDRVITSHLSTVVDGADVRLEDAEE